MFQLNEQPDGELKYRVRLFLALCQVFLGATEAIFVGVNVKEDQYVFSHSLQLFVVAGIFLWLVLWFAEPIFKMPRKTVE